MEMMLGNGYANPRWFHGRLNRFFNDAQWAPETERERRPLADVVEHGDGYHFYFDMPGIKADSVEVRVEDGDLVVEAERKRPEWPKEAEVHISERGYGKLARVFSLPDDASHDGIKATYRDGVLEVAVTKKPEAKPTRIKVNVEN